MPGPSTLPRVRVWSIAAALLLLPRAAGAPSPSAPLRLHGLVEAVEFFNLVTPSGINGQLTIVHIAPKGTHVKKGDLIVEFDRQQPLREAIDKQAEWKQLEEDIRKKQAELKLQEAVDDTAIKTAENDLALARLETTKNDVLPRIEAEKNTLNLQAAEARLPSLRTSVALKRKAAAAELEILEVKRDRAARVRDRAMATAEALLVLSPIDGLVVPRTLWKTGARTGRARGRRQRLAGHRGPRRRQPARDARQGQGQPGRRAPAGGGHAGPRHAGRVSRSQLPGAPAADLADRGTRRLFGENPHVRGDLRPRGAGTPRSRPISRPRWTS